MISIDGHKIYRKVVHNKRNLDPRLTEYLEETLKSKIGKLQLLACADKFWRWELTGLEDRQLANAPTSQRSTFFYLKPVLVQLWPDTLVRVCKRTGKKDLILDFVDGNSLFRKFTREEIAEADSHRYLWEVPCMGEKYSKSEHNIIPGPIVIF